MQLINKEGGLHLKDNFEGGATWAFEVGSRSMVCPIIVEDLNPPRQMLVEVMPFFICSAIGAVGFKKVSFILYFQSYISSFDRCFVKKKVSF
jgi:hypothetical protein